MERWLLISLSLVGACLAGIACGQLVLCSPASRDAIGVLCRRGHLLAIAQGEGIYEVDLQRALSELRYASGVDEKDRQEGETKGVKKVTNVKRVTTLQVGERLVLTDLISNSVVRSLAADEKISKGKIGSALNLLRWQFPNEKAWRIALGASDLSARSLRRFVTDDLRVQHWITRQIAPRIDATEIECRNFYEMHQSSFAQPVRFRASHLFVAAPAKTPQEVVETKQQTIKSLAERIKQGEKLTDLAAVGSEDEATKNRGGDLEFFSESRMPPDFFAAVAKMHIGEISQPIRTRLGFHIIELTDSKPARQMSFEEARAEIRLIIENEKRRTALQNLVRNLSRRAEVVTNRLSEASASFENRSENA